jgi:erythromycin esterase
MKYKKLPFTLIFVLLFSMNLFAQQSLNLDFEIKSVEGINRPWGWSIKSWGPVIFKMDSLVVKNGRFSLHAGCTNAQDQKAVQSLSFGIEAFELREKKITLTGSIRTEGLKGTAGLSLGYTYLSSKTDGYIEVDTTSGKASGTSDWRTFSVNLFIPANAQSVYVTADHAGEGKAWFDDLTLSIAGKTIHAVSVANSLSKENIRWLNKNNFPVYTVIPTENTKNDDLDPFKKVAANSRLIALGESTHGTSEFFSLKNRLWQYAVTELGFRVFAIEDNQLAAEEVNKYVHGGKGSGTESMAGMFSVWYTEEVLALIEWVRHYNDDHVNDKLSFVGFDMQEIGRPVDSLISFLKDRDIDLYKKNTDFLKDIKENGPQSYSVSDSVKLLWFNAAKEILNEVKVKSTQLISTLKSAVDAQKVMLGIQYANLVKQFAEHTYKGHWSLYRDEAMAENVSWLLENRYPKNKMVLWAHDVHISRCDHSNKYLNLNTSISMGSFLSRKYGNAFTSFSLSTYEGEYLAFKSYTDFTRINAPLFKGPVGSLDEALHRVAIAKENSNLFLPLTRTETWLSEPLPKRFANHVNIDYGYWERVSIPYQFDGIFFIDKTTASKYLKKQKLK